MANVTKTKASLTTAQPSLHNAHPSLLAKLPLSEELLRYYRQRIETSENELLSFADAVDNSRETHLEQRKLLRELQLRVKEIQSLQHALAESQQAHDDECSRLAQALAENDELRIQELKDRRKIKYLLSITSAPGIGSTIAPGAASKSTSRILQQRNSVGEVVTYFRPAVDTRLVSGQNGRTCTTSDAQNSGISKVNASGSRRNVAVSGLQSSCNACDFTVGVGGEMRDIEMESLQLQVCALRAQLVEQAQTYEERMSRWRADIHLSAEEESLRARNDEAKISDLSEKVFQLQETLRENTKELIFIRKNHLTNERTMREERYKLEQMVNKLRIEYNDLQSKCENMEKIVEARITKRKEVVLKDLKQQVQRLDRDLCKTRDELKAREVLFQKRIIAMREKSKVLVNSYKNLKRRRAFEVEGFTNDIVMLRKQLKDMEKTLLRTGEVAVVSGEEREIRLLTQVARGSKQTTAVYKALGELRAMVNRVEESVI